MKSYQAIQAGDIYVSDGERKWPLLNNGTNWDSPAGQYQIAVAILADVLGDTERAQRLRTRFAWRAVIPFAKAQHWKMTEGEVIALVNDIETIEKQTATERARVAREPPRGIGDDRGDARLGIAWDQSGEA